MDEQSLMMQGLVSLSRPVHGGLALDPPHDHQDDGGKQDIGDILHQIMAITDQSLDEAQAKLVDDLLHTLIYSIFIYFYYLQTIIVLLLRKYDYYSIRQYFTITPLHIPTALYAQSIIFY